jgi:hypothetical protein
MGRKLPEAVSNIIVTYLKAGRPVPEIVAATKAHKTTVYRICLNLDLWGVPYPPATVKLGAPKLLVYEQELVISYSIWFNNFKTDFDIV